jgi:hypothetical protein
VFSGGNDGATPNGSLAFGKDGALYGTAGGGKESRGVVFRFARLRGGRWVETVLYNFTDGKDGLGPGSVILDSSGNLYGPAFGGAKLRGVIFKMGLAKNGEWKFAVLYTFTGAPDAAYPNSGLVFGQNGELFGTSEGGGTGTACDGGCGTVFKVSP